MKTTLIAAMLLVLASPAHTIEIPKDWLDNYDNCHGDDESVDHVKACAASRKIEKQLRQEGARNYREGLCYRARPYPDNSMEQDLWYKGYKDAEVKDRGRRDFSHCHPRSLIKEDH